MRFVPYRTQREVSLATPGTPEEMKRWLQSLSGSEFALNAEKNGRSELARFWRKRGKGDVSDLLTHKEMSPVVQTFCEGVAEKAWFTANRPFYNVYPVVMDMVMGVKLTFPFTHVRLPYSAIVFQFPDGAGPQVILGGASRRLNSMLWYCGADELSSDKSGKMFVCIANFGQDFVPPYVMVMEDEEMQRDVEEVLQEQREMRATWIEDEENRGIKPLNCQNALSNGVSALHAPLKAMPVELTDTYDWCWRLLILASLLAAGHDLVTPVLLAKDRQEADLLGERATQEWIERRAQKARQRGVLGFDIGKKLQQEKDLSPHFRNPHLALYHVGPGRTETRVMLRRGSVVISRALTQIPTGFLGPETAEEREACDRVFTRESISARTRFFILKRDEYRCQICGADARSNRDIQLHIDHKVPVVKGGSSDIANLWATCSKCNLGEGTSDL